MNRNSASFWKSLYCQWSLCAGLAGALMSTGCANRQQAAPAVTDQIQFTQQVSVPPNSRILEIKHHGGDVKVAGWNESYILLEGVKRATADSVEEAKGMLDFIGIQAYERAPDRLVLEYNGPTNLLAFGRSAAGVDVTVHVPASMPVDIENNDGDVHLENLDGNVSVDHRNGDVKAEGIGGRLQIRSQGRNVIVKDAARAVQMDVKDANIRADNIGESLSIKHSKGEIQISDVDGRLILNCVDSAITAEKIRGRIEVDNRKGDVVLREFYEGVQATVHGGTLNMQPMIPVAQSYYCGVVTGDIILRVPDTSNMLVEITAEQGRIHSDYNLQIWADKSASYARGAVGNGQNTVKLNVKKGSASLLKQQSMGVSASPPQTGQSAQPANNGLTPATIN